MRRNSGIILLLLMALILLTLPSVAQGQVLGKYTPPYVELNVPGRIYAAYFDGVKLWVVYEQGGSTHIAVYVYHNGTFTQEWVVTVPGTPVKTAVDDNLEYMAVVTSWKILAVYDVRGAPVLRLDRGFRFKPVDLALVSTQGRGKPDVVLVVDKGGDGYWVYAYPLAPGRVKRSELWITTANVANKNAFSVIIPRLAGGRQGAPYIIVVAANTTLLNYTRLGANVTVAAHSIIYSVYRVKRLGLNVVFEKVSSGNVTLGYELGESPYDIISFSYVAAYVLPATSPLGNTTLIVLSAKLQPIHVPNVTNPIPSAITIDGLVVIDVERNESIVRYSDANTPTIDFYPLGGPATAATVTLNGEYLLVGSQDYNVYVFALQVPGNVYQALYSISLGSPVATLEAAPVPSVVVAGSSGGMAMAFRLLDGVVYWKLPAQANVASISVTGTTYAAVGTANGRLFVFTNARSFLHYLGFIVESRKARSNSVIQSTLTNITIVGVYNGLLVNMSYHVKLSSIISGSFYTLLPATNYTVIIDNPVLGVAVRRVMLFADVYYVLRDQDFTMPMYNLTICVNDSLTGIPLNNVIVVANYTPILELPANKTYTLVIRRGCASAKLPRGYYILALSSWRYHRLLEGVKQPIRLYHDTLLEAKAIPYTSLVVFKAVTTYGMPLPGVNITLVDIETGLRLSVTTGGSGTAMLSSVPYGIYKISFSYPYTQPYASQVTINSSSVVINATLKPRVYYVTIMPVDAETGAPIRGAMIELVRKFDGYTIKEVLEQGYALLKLEYGEYSLVVKATGYEEKTLDLIVEKDMLVKPALTPIIYPITIEVIDSLYQRPMPAKITVYNVELLKSYNAVTRTGRAVFQLRAGTYRVMVEPFYGYPAEAILHVPATRSLIIEVMPRNYTIVLTPIDAEVSKPLASFGYRASGIISCSDTGNWTLTWVNGSLVATIPYSVSCTAVITAPGYVTARVPLGAVNSNKSLEVPLQPVKYALTLNVLSTYGIGLAFNATLKELRTGVVYKASGVGKTVVEVRPGRYTLLVEARYHTPAELNLTVPKETSVTVRLKPRIYTLSLSVVDGETGKLVTHVIVVVERVAPKPGKPVRVNVPGGTASIPLPWGTYRLVVQAPGYQETIVTVTLPSKAMTVTLTPVKVPVRVIVVDKLTKRPIPNATISFYGVRSGFAVQARTGAKGEAVLELRADIYHVVVTAPLHTGSEMTLNLLNASKKGVETRIELAPVEYTLTLLVYDGLTRTPYKGKLSIGLVRLEGGYKKVVNATGPRVSLTLPYGKYKITIKANKYEQTSITVVLNASTVKKVSLPRSKYSVKVKVIDARFGRPVPNAVVVFTLAGRGLTVYTGITNQKGEVTASIPWGTYILRVEAGGYRSTSKIVIVSVNNMVVPVFLEPLPVKIVMDLLPAGIIGGAIVGSAVWIARRIRRRPAALEFEEEELE